MTLSELRRVLELVEPFKDGEWCLQAEHDELTIVLARKPDAEVSHQLGDMNCVLSWMMRDDDENLIDDPEWDDETLVVTCFT